MTTHTTPTYTMNLQTNGAIMLDVERRLRQMKAAEKKTESTYMDWQQLVAQHNEPAPMHTSDNDVAPLVGALLTGLLDMLFGGMPVMQLLAHGMEGAIGVAHADQPSTTPTPTQTPLHSVSKINNVLKLSQQKRFTGTASAQQAQTRQMQMLQQMTLMLMMNMLGQQDETATGSGGEGEVVPDVLRDPKMARFKQNRHSISCIRTMFNDQVSMTVPRYSAPRLHMN